MYPVAGSPLSQARLVGSILLRPNSGITITRPITTDAPTHRSCEISRVRSAARGRDPLVYSCSRLAMRQGINPVAPPATKTMQGSRQTARRLWSWRSAGGELPDETGDGQSHAPTCLAQLLRRAHGLRGPLRGVGRSNSARARLQTIATDETKH